MLLGFSTPANIHIGEEINAPALYGAYGIRRGENDMTGPEVRPENDRSTSRTRAPLVDPRDGDIEDDASSTQQRSFLAIAGSLLAEVSLPKLLLAWTVAILLPAILLGLVPLIATAWFAKAAGKLTGLRDLGAVFFLVVIIGLGLIGWRPLLRMAERNF